MNGLSLLLYLTLFAQATAPLGSAGSSGATSTFGAPTTNVNPGTAPLGSAANSLNSAIADPTKDDSRTYGWQINEYKELEYIVQVSPSLLSFMQNPADKQELASQIPPALVGRVKRVVVRIGNEVLPRTPLDEIEKLFPAIASLPPGRLKEIDSGAIVNVNNSGGNGTAGFPQAGASGLNNTATAPLGSTFADQARGVPSSTPTQGSLLDRFASNGTAISGQSSRFNNTAQNPTAQNPTAQNSTAQNLGAGRLADARGNLNSGQGFGGQGYVPDLTGQRSADPYALGATGSGSSGFGNNGLGTSGVGSSSSGSSGFSNGALGNSGFAGIPASNQFGQSQLGQNQFGQAVPYSNDYNNAGANGLGYGGNRFGNSVTGYPNDPGYNQNVNPALAGQVPNRQGFASTTGFGDAYAQSGNPLLDPRRVGSTYADLNGLSQASGYLASNQTPRTDLPSTSTGSQLADRGTSQRPTASYRNDLQAGPYSTYPATENNYFFYIFFILSVAINLWMVHLLRSLYLRYRNLLSSLRSQATTSLG